MSVEKMKILDYFMIAHGKECDKRLLSYFKSFSFRGNSYVLWKTMKILDYFMITHGKECD